ncbi:hypothetical protein H9M94_00250 [Mycoplasma sp. Pen4]|uniref:hypothetical protein n=1 Tax=Mycoplasma sp. Pen4 TaxID=640330 RepID=UPI00165467FF|nr:hypothetical protein [Mycoplasma sp. Pen4]QNM93698.1 hypothetical protein H9M94_00250 [Mycoplasma sp. Pen4]
MIKKEYLFKVLKITNWFYLFAISILLTLFTVNKIIHHDIPSKILLMNLDKIYAPIAGIIILTVFLLRIYVVIRIEKEYSKLSKNLIYRAGFIPFVYENKLEDEYTFIYKDSETYQKYLAAKNSLNILRYQFIIGIWIFTYLIIATTICTIWAFKDWNTFGKLSWKILLAFTIYNIVAISYPIYIFVDSINMIKSTIKVIENREISRNELISFKVEKIFEKYKEFY